MNKFIVIGLSFLFFCVTSAPARVVTQGEAMKIAGAFFKQSRMVRTTSNVSLLWDSNALNCHARSVTDSPTFYVFSNDHGKGFVIVSGDDVTYPVIAYSSEHSLPDCNQLPPAMRHWLVETSRMIEQGRKQHLSSSREIKQVWDDIEVGNLITFLATANWGQDAPYNKYCPLDGSERSVIGCTSTAIGIVMHYHKWPKKGIGFTPSYRTSTKNIQVESRNLEHPYNWEVMPTFAILGNSVNGIDDAATFLADLACSLQADFSANNTGAPMSLSVLQQNFNYSPNMYFAAKKDYSELSWTNLIKGELDKSRPVLVSALNSIDDVGHAYVLDGYTDDSFFHVNWGWNGSCNGFFRLTKLNPTLDMEYNKEQTIVLNLTPNDQPSEIKDQIRFDKDDLVVTKQDFAQNEPFYIDRLAFYNVSSSNFSGSFIGAHTDKSGNLKEFVTTALSSNLESQHKVAYTSVLAKIKEPIRIGDRIRFYYRSAESEKWELVKPIGERVDWEVLIADEYYIKECTSFAYDRTLKEITIQTKAGVRVSLFDANRIKVDKGLTQHDTRITIKTDGLKAGKYTLLLEKGGDRKELNFEIKSL